MISIIFNPGWRNLPITWLLSTRFVQSVMKFQLGLAWLKFVHVIVIPFLHCSQPAFTCLKLTTETFEQKCEICSKLKIKLPKRRHWPLLTLNIFHTFVLVFVLLTLNMQLPPGFSLIIQEEISWRFNELKFQLGSHRICW